MTPDDDGDTSVQISLEYNLAGIPSTSFFVLVRYYVDTGENLDDSFVSSLDLSAFGQTLLSQALPFFTNTFNDYWELPFLVINDDDTQNTIDMSLSFQTTFTNPPLLI